MDNLGVLPPEFPRVGHFSSAQVEKSRVDQVSVDGVEDKETGKQGMFLPPGQCDPQSQLPWQGPLRTIVDVPERLPIAAIPENRKE